MLLTLGFVGKRSGTMSEASMPEIASRRRNSEPEPTRMIGPVSSSRWMRRARRVSSSCVVTKQSGASMSYSGVSALLASLSLASCQLASISVWRKRAMTPM